MFRHFVRARIVVGLARTAEVSNILPTWFEARERLVGLPLRDGIPVNAWEKLGRGSLEGAPCKEFAERPKELKGDPNERSGRAP